MDSMFEREVQAQAFSRKPDGSTLLLLEVRVDGRWGRADSFLLGVLPTGAVHFAKAQPAGSFNHCWPFWSLIGNGGMHLYSSPYIIINALPW